MCQIRQFNSPSQVPVGCHWLIIAFLVAPLLLKHCSLNIDLKTIGAKNRSTSGVSK
jgi:hypothetical protein